MTELPLSYSPRPESPQGGALRTRNMLIILSAAALGLAVVVIYGAWNHYSEKFGTVNHSADSIQIHSSPSPAGKNLPENSVRVVLDTVYQNSQSGVTLKLPGLWHQIKDAPIPKPDPDHRFCVLSSQDLTVMFWPQFPELLPSLDADVQVMRKQFSRSGSLILKSEKVVMVRGRMAKELEFVLPASGFRMDLLMVRDWPALYVLAVIGSQKSEQAWQLLEDTLPEAIEIR